MIGSILNGMPPDQFGFALVPSPLQAHALRGKARNKKLQQLLPEQEKKCKEPRARLFPPAISCSKF